MRNKRRKTGEKNFWGTVFSGVFVLFVVVAVFFLGRNIYHSLKRISLVNKEVESLRLEAEKINRENKDLNKLIEYFSSRDFQEKEIRDKLNLVKEGERVVVVKELNVEEPKLVDEDGHNVIVNRANYYYWWKYFFGTDF